MWDTFMAVDDQEQQSVSEIELEMLDQDRLRQEILLQKQWKEEQISSKSHQSYLTSSSSPALMRAPPATAGSNMGSVSGYLTSMATSFIKTTEQLFNSTHFTNPSNETLYEKIKKATSRSSFYASSGGGSHQLGFRERIESLGWKKGPSESHPSSGSRKDSSKID